MSLFPETAPAPVGHTVLGLLVGTALTVLLLVCTIAGMILQKLSRNSSRSLSETVQGPVARGEEYLQMERSSMAQEETGLGEKRVKWTGVNYEVTPSDNFNRESYVEEYNGRENFMGRGIIDIGGGEQMSHPVTKYGNKHISDRVMKHVNDRGIIHGSDNDINLQSSDHGLVHVTDHITSHGIDPSSVLVEQECDDGWSGYGHQDTRILLPSRNSYISQPRTNIKLNPIFE